jgi:hypothetical protein
LRVLSGAARAGVGAGPRAALMASISSPPRSRLQRDPDQLTRRRKARPLTVCAFEHRLRRKDWAVDRVHDDILAGYKDATISSWVPLEVDCKCRLENVRNTSVAMAGRRASRGDARSSHTLRTPARTV